MDIRTKDLGPHVVLQVEGDVDLYNVGELKSAIFKKVEDEVESLIIDMSGVPYMDSSGVGALVAGQKRMRSNGGKFAILNVQQDVLSILQLASLDKFFTIYESEEDLMN
ncbi:MAG: STAS domain-containing protein [Leptospiraceae bacterium]|nr:STAS domain-containing protein [Leptospiraceae bacterium]MCB1199925.1 STAS domain-containing protein [Leptospiraceae bacterium]